MIKAPFIVFVAVSTLVDVLIFLGVLFASRRERQTQARKGLSQKSVAPASRGWKHKRDTCATDETGMGSKPTLTAPRLVAAALATVAVFLLKLPLLRVLGLNAFGMINLIYVDLVVALPLLSLIVLGVSILSRQRNPGPRVSRTVQLLCVFGLLAAPVGVHASFIEPYRLKEETATIPVPSQRAGGEPIRVGVLADIQTAHVTDYERNAVARLMALRPDLVVMPGDLFHGRYSEFQQEAPALRELLSALDAPGGAYMVLGDVDAAPDLRPLLNGTPVQLLINETVRISVGDRRVTIAGVDLECRKGDTPSFINAVAAMPGDEDIRILLAHRPDAVLELAEHSRIDLVIAGHTHGGQVVLPFFGPPITLSDVPRRVAAGGLHELDGNRIYVSRGVGCERGQAPPLRFLCPPEISLLTLGAIPD